MTSVSDADSAGAAEAPTRKALLEDAARRLAEAGLEAPRRQAEWLLGDVLGTARAGLYADLLVPVAPADAARFRQMLARRLAREPLQYVLGHANFYGLRLRVSPAVLIPRPETEVVVETALRLVAGREAPRVLDVGTGSGCMALAVARERPDADVLACDVSRDALAIARANADALALNVTLGRADVLADDFPAQLAALAGEDAVRASGDMDEADGGLFDLVVSNPPYVPDAEADALQPEVRLHEPPVALFTGNGPLRFYHALARHAPRLLRPGGVLVTETHADFADAAASVLADAGFAEATTAADLAGRPRVAWARWPH